MMIRRGPEWPDGNLFPWFGLDEALGRPYFGLHPSPPHPVPKLEETDDGRNPDPPESDPYPTCGPDPNPFPWFDPCGWKVKTGCGPIPDPAPSLPGGR